MKNGRGRIELITGPMFAGKTSELIKRVRRYSRRLGRPIRLCSVIVKFDCDTRYESDRVVTHDRDGLPAVRTHVINDISPEILYDNGIRVLCVDEGHFFKGLHQWANRAADVGMIVVITMLNGDSNREPFDGQDLLLYSYADKIDHLRAVCDLCGHDAPFTHRKTDSTHQIEIGASESYGAVCRSCWRDLNSSE
jgi:thymidine kinase